MLHIGERDARFAQAIGDRLRGKAGPMLDAAEALLLRRRDELAVAHERGRRIAVKGVEAEDDHLLEVRNDCPWSLLREPVRASARRR